MNTTVGSPIPGGAQRSQSQSRSATSLAERPDMLRGKPSLAMIGLLVVTMVIGYEWFVSGLVKFVRGDFPSGLSAELLQKSAGTSEWYSDFLKSVAIPHGELFGYAIESAELLAGVALIVGPLIWLSAWDRVSDLTRSAVLFVIAAAAIGATFLAINLHIANNGSHPWLLPADGFDEGIDLDSELPAIQIVIATVCILVLLRHRRSGSELQGGRNNELL